MNPNNSKGKKKARRHKKKPPKVKPKVKKQKKIVDTIQEEKNLSFGKLLDSSNFKEVEIQALKSLMNNPKSADGKWISDLKELYEIGEVESMEILDNLKLVKLDNVIKKLQKNQPKTEPSEPKKSEKKNSAPAEKISDAFKKLVEEHPAISPYRRKVLLDTITFLEGGASSSYVEDKLTEIIQDIHLTYNVIESDDEAIKTINLMIDDGVLPPSDSTNTKIKGISRGTVETPAEAKLESDSFEEKIYQSEILTDAEKDFFRDQVGKNTNISKKLEEIKDLYKINKEMAVIVEKLKFIFKENIPSSTNEKVGESSKPVVKEDLDMSIFENFVKYTNGLTDNQKNKILEALNQPNSNLGQRIFEIKEFHESVLDEKETLESLIF